MTVSRLIRINDARQIRAKAPEYVGKRISLILTDQRVVLGEVKKAGTDGIIITNMRGKDMAYSFNHISEIYFDFVD